MDKRYAIRFVKKFGVKALIDTLVSNGEEATAKDLIENCWGFSRKEVAQYIKDNWNF